MRTLHPLLATLTLWVVATDVLALGTNVCEQASDTASYNACSAAELQQAQSQMQETFDAAKIRWRGSAETVTALDRSQQTWETSYRADVAARFAEMDAALERGEHVGTAYTSAHNWYEARLIRARTEWLCNILRGPAYGEIERAPCAELVRQALATSKN